MINKQLTLTLIFSPLLAWSSSEIPSSSTNKPSVSQATVNTPIRIQQNVERKERESKEREFEDIAATPEQWEDLKNFIHLIAKTTPMPQRTKEERISEAKDFVTRWTHNKVTRRLFEAIDTQAAIEEITKLVEQFPYCLNARDHRKIFSIFKNEQEIMGALIFVNAYRTRFFNDPVMESYFREVIAPAFKALVSRGKMHNRIIWSVHGITLCMRASEEGNPFAKMHDGIIRSLHGSTPLFRPFGKMYDGIIGSMQGITPLMRASAQGNETLLEFLLSKQADIFDITGINGWMVDDNAHINLRSFLRNMTRDFSPTVVLVTPVNELPEEIPLAKALMLKPLFEFFVNFDALSIATLAGNPDVVERLKNHLVNKSGSNPEEVGKIIRKALQKIIKLSDSATAECARELFASLGIVDPKRENYLVIAQKLIRAYIDITSQYDQLIPSHIVELFLDAMSFGSPEMFEVIAQELAHFPPYKPILIPAPDRARNFVDHHICGEKLGILESINAKEGSVVHAMAHLMLKRANDLAYEPGNNEFVARLQQFVREHQIMPQVTEELNKYLPPVLVPIVSEYLTLSRAPRPERCNHILAWRTEMERPACCPMRLPVRVVQNPDSNAEAISRRSKDEKKQQ